MIQKFTTSTIKERSIRIGWLSNDEHVVTNSKKKGGKKGMKNVEVPFGLT